VAWKSLASWSGWHIALLTAVWVGGVIGYLALRTARAQELSSASTDTYFIAVHVHHPFAIFLGPPLLLLASWLWRRWATRPAS
jgi:hypothetical protein